jgi:hypothetical protein
MVAPHSFVEQNMEFGGEFHPLVMLLCGPAAKGTHRWLNK